MKIAIWFTIFASVSIILFFTSLWLPPTGQIDPSVLTATSQLTGMTALATLIFAISKGYRGNITTKAFTINISPENKEEDEKPNLENNN